MSSIMRTSAIIAVLLLCSSFSIGKEAAEPDYAKIEAQVKATYAQITKAAESVDAERLFRFVLDNDKGALIRNGRITLTCQEAFYNYKRNIVGIQRVSYKMDREYVTVVSPETAVMVAEGSFEATTTEGNTFGAPFAQTVIFVLRDNQWKVLHSHTSSPNARQ
jgi:ketosteroid isomerase-like protein